ncbi:hypothetical protein [Pedobacter gandavensis]|uniref:helix-turn-helix transcriptional regulator n=1 Tax=Pedobacter gandavensis TaxID=2679963 RepID=UPI00292CEEC8|nr:hypothetical protein [Pedobacter gandavensis]
MLTQKVIVVAYDDAKSFLVLLDKLKETAAFSYHIISATMATGLKGILQSLEPDLIILCFRNNQHVLDELRPLTVLPLIPILCLSNRFENERLAWHQNNSVFTCQLENLHQASYLSSRVSSILLMSKEQPAPQKVMGLADAAIAAAGTDDTRNLSRYVMELDQKVEVLLKVKERIGELYPNVDDRTRTELISIVNSIKISANDHKLWDDFKLYFEQINPGFLLQLTSNYPSLTSTDLKYCCYLKMNMSNDDIRNLLGINQESVRTHKYRLKKKMSLSREQDLLTYLRTVDQHKLALV